jgi:hypothetical protein
MSNQVRAAIALAMNLPSVTLRASTGGPSVKRDVFLELAQEHVRRQTRVAQVLGEEVVTADFPRRLERERVVARACCWAELLACLRASACAAPTRVVVPGSCGEEGN